VGDSSPKSGNKHRFQACLAKTNGLEKKICSAFGGEERASGGGRRELVGTDSGLSFSRSILVGAGEKGVGIMGILNVKVSGGGRGWPLRMENVESAICMISTAALASGHYDWGELNV